MIRYIIIFILVIGGKFSLFGQDYQSHNIVCSVDSLNFSLKEKKIFIFGELHFRDHETSKYQLQLIRKMIANGVKKIKIYIECPPSSIYFINEYLEKKAIPATNDIGIVENDSSLLDGIRLYKDSIQFRFIPIDLESHGAINFTRIFLKEYLAKVPNEMYFKELGELQSAKSAKYIRKTAIKILNDSLLTSKFKDVVDKKYKDLFFDVLSIVADYGFVRFGRSKKGIEARERRMAQVINNTYDSSVQSILTVGVAHITPREKKTLADLILNIHRFNRLEMIIMPIVYSKSRYLYIGDKLYYTINDFIKFIDSGMFDAILIPCDMKAEIKK